MEADRIGLNLFHLVPGETGGVEVYDRLLIEALLQARPQLRLTLFAFREAASSLREEPWGGDIELATLPFSGRSRLVRVAAEQALAPLARRHRIQLLHNLLTTAPAIPGVPQVTTIHDVIYKRYPETHFGLLAVGLAALVPIAVRRSRRLLTPSQATKSDLVELFGVAPERVDVTYEGPGLPLQSNPPGANELRSRFDLGEAPIVLTVSAKRPHKNLERLLDAFARIEVEPAPVLVVPGYGTAHETQLRRRAGARVRFAGWVDDATLDGLYRAATCVVLPSLAEGFGLPVLEAMARGIPVACSNVSSLPEVAGDAALYFDPLDVEGIAQTIQQLLRDATLREQLVRAGLDRAGRFTWNAAAEATLQSYEKALSAT
jgi:glycosyltransferase involved in cell wall biosynthesis